MSLNLKIPPNECQCQQSQEKREIFLFLKRYGVVLRRRKWQCWRGLDSKPMRACLLGFLRAFTRPGRSANRNNRVGATTTDSSEPESVSFKPQSRSPLLLSQLQSMTASAQWRNAESPEFEIELSSKTSRTRRH